MQDYGLDPKHYITLPSYSFDCMLRFTSVQLDLICEPDMALFVESSIRSGVSIVTSRLATANNPSVDAYDVTKPTSYVNYFDAVNLYGSSMCKLLPVGEIRVLSEEEIESFDIMKVDPNGSTGYRVQVDLLYPPELHDLHNCLPIAPSHLEITKDILSDVTIELGEKHGQKFRPQKKFATTLENKEKYICHSSNLKFYIEHGLVLTKIHKVFSYMQSTWLAPYINFKTERRKMAVNSFTKDFYKLMSNKVCTYLFVISWLMSIQRLQ